MSSIWNNKRIYKTWYLVKISWCTAPISFKERINMMMSTKLPMCFQRFWSLDINRTRQENEFLWKNLFGRNHINRMLKESKYKIEQTSVIFPMCEKSLIHFLSIDSDLKFCLMTGDFIYKFWYSRRCDGIHTLSVVCKICQKHCFWMKTSLSKPQPTWLCKACCFYFLILLPLTIKIDLLHMKTVFGVVW